MLHGVRSRYSVVGIVAKQPKNYITVPGSGKRFFYSETSRPASSSVVTGTCFPFSKAGHVSPSSAEVKNELICTSTPTYIFMTFTGTTRPLPWTSPTLRHVPKGSNFDSHLRISQRCGIQKLTARGDTVILGTVGMKQTSDVWDDNTGFRYKRCCLPVLG
jgi:hypothetical protein